MKSRVSWSYESNELLDVVESFFHNIVTPVRSYADGTQAACIIPFLSRYGSATLPPC